VCPCEDLGEEHVKAGCSVCVGGGGVAICLCYDFRLCLELCCLVAPPDLDCWL
jgi:hypothetical protein